ncbi:hypothetical protein SNOG_07164 [Parastagonospora nodorum SN15]|uniref:Uncharacterized protein n=1 Tax=Phaeosphaeria nodorum (strain SN15 / ATCC MYA-4574 / FGSC 10173) TaxID=321614 RepID=Q0UM50_PHANO|nr:hypothetical protein SNOG_07164 [Parastagonospora nodorum SN15]EAT85815.1 hypothetical protein SNOG_07164 [Parastagonospora nodorum SN15]
MAMTDLVASRAAYLHEAAHMLAVSSPAASAFLGLARNRLIEDTELEVPAKEWDALRRETCALQPQLRRHMKRSESNVAKQLPIISKSSNEEAPKVPKTANASSKQRQKSRKGGLQAMLEKNKTQNSKPGLDLMDFMM